ncbi:MAG: coenzyme F420-0:L-glutamate ligase [Methanophagales archaeon]|nr:coenzyme F420-0:L-glutamate ligase [Methanophagales archaeon]
MKKKGFTDHLEIIGIDHFPEVKEGDDLTDLFFKALEEKREKLEDGDAIVFTSKIISKSEGRVVDLSGVKIGSDAERIAKETDKDPRIVQLILNETKEIVRTEKNIILVETKHGFVCANAGVDESNVEEGKAVLLPEDPQRSASRLKKEIEERSGEEISVLISDSFGRAFRDGVTGICIGVSGITALLDRRGEEDRFGKIARITKEAVADEICAAANLVIGEFKEGIPIAIVRGLKLKRSEGDIKEVLFNREDDLFR